MISRSKPHNWAKQGLKEPCRRNAGCNSDSKSQIHTNHYFATKFPKDNKQRKDVYKI